MSRAVFETATLADAIRKAARFAPTKGAELDKAGGIVIDLSDPVDTPLADIRSTDLRVFYRQTIRPIELTITRTSWRVSSVLLEAVTSRLPMGLGSTVTLYDEQNSLHIQAGKVKAKLNLINDEVPFPEWEPFDPFGLSVVENFAQRVSQVRWATDTKANNVLSGVHIDGQQLIATDGKCAVRVPLECPLAAPVTAPLSELIELIKDHPEVALRATSESLEVMPDQDTQVRVVLLKGEYPNVAIVIDNPMVEHLTTEKGPLLAAIDRLLALDSSDRFPVMRMLFDGSSLEMKREVPDIGWINEELELETLVPFYEMWVNPILLRNMLQNTSHNEVELAWGADSLSPFKVSDGTGYEVVGLPRRKTA